MEEPHQGGGAAGASDGAGPTQEERNWALAAHLGPLLVALLTGGLLGFVVPLAIWFAKRDESPFVADQAKESLNFRITLVIGYALCVPFIFILIGILFWFVIWVCEIVLATIAAIQASEGKRYRYPFAVRLL